MLSVNLTLRGQPVLVVGAGQVGRRRSELLAGAGASVTVVDPRPFSLAAIRQFVEPFQPAHLFGMRLAFACATPEVNATVVTAARAAGVWVNSASDLEGSDFTLPSVGEVGGLRFAVSTGGASPALAKRIAAELPTHFDPAYGEWVRVLGEVRTAVRALVTDEQERRKLLAGFAEPHWLTRIQELGPQVVLAEMLQAADRK